MKVKLIALFIASFVLPSLWGQSTAIKIKAKVFERIKLEDQTKNGDYTIRSKNQGGISIILKKHSGRFPASSDNRILHLKEGQSYQFNTREYGSVSIIAP